MENPATTRFCVSVEQMVPYLENLCNGNAELVDSADGSSNRSSLPADGDNSGGLLEATNGCEDDYVNYIDLSELNPIVEACNCLQIDDLIEGMCLFSFRVWPQGCIVSISVLKLSARLFVLIYRIYVLKLQKVNNKLYHYIAPFCRNNLADA